MKGTTTMPLGQHGTYTRSTLDLLTLERLAILKERAKEFTKGVPFSSGCIIRAAVALLHEESARWSSMEPMEILPAKRRLLDAKKARPAVSMDDDVLREIQARG
jgi:hypothetical protein